MDLGPEIESLLALMAQPFPATTRDLRAAIERRIEEERQKHRTVPRARKPEPSPAHQGKR